MINVLSSSCGITWSLMIYIHTHIIHILASSRRPFSFIVVTSLAEEDWREMSALNKVIAESKNKRI